MATYTDNYNLEKPDQTDVYNIVVFNDNADKVDAALGAKVDTDGGDISSTNITSLEESTEEFPVPVAGETSKTFFGKVRKFIQDFNNFKTGILTVGMIVNNAVTNNSGLPVSAAVAKALQDQLTQLTSDLDAKTSYPKPVAGVGSLASANINSSRVTSIVALNSTDILSVTNLPIQSSGVLRTTVGGSYCIQEYLTDAKLYIRMYNGSTWGSWA